MIVSLFLLLITDWTVAKSVDNLSLRATADTDCWEDRSELQIFLTVSSLASINHSVVTKRQLELNWKVKSPKSKDIVALYDLHPHEYSYLPLDFVYVADHPSGYYRTKTELPTYTFTKENITYGCLDFYIAYISEDKIVKVNCLKTRPNWMIENREYIDNFTLLDIMIPGTHDSGSYSSFPYSYHSKIFSSFIYTQEETIFNQLVYGIRYLDLRVMESHGRFIIDHGFFETGNTLEEVLSDVRDFVNATQEIVILDFHKHPLNFQQKRLVKYVKNMLNLYLIPNKNSLKIGDIFDSPHRILLSFNDPAVSDPYIWPFTCQIWGDVTKVDDLKLFFERFYNSSTIPSFLWSSMAELTPNLKFIIEHGNEGLRVLADFVNRNVTQWFSRKWGMWSNIVATDYFLGNDIVSVAIDINRKKTGCQIKKLFRKESRSFTCSKLFLV